MGIVVGDMSLLVTLVEDPYLLMQDSRATKLVVQWKRSTLNSKALSGILKSQDNEYMLMMVDSFTKWVSASPFPNRGNNSGCWDK